MLPASAPKLSKEDLKAELARFHAVEHRSQHTAFFGTGDAGLIDVPLAGHTMRFRVVLVDCELRLRELLDGRDDAEPLVLLVDYTDRLPVDVGGRLARGELSFISRERRLANLFGAKTVSSALLEGPLASALLADARPYDMRVDGTTLDEHTAWRAYLSRAVGLSSLGELTEALVIEQLTASTVSSTSESRDGHAVLNEAAREYLRRVAGPIAGLAWSAWQQGRALAVAALSFVIEALADHLDDRYVLGFLEGQLESLDKDAARNRALLSRWKDVVPALALRLEQNQPVLFARVLADADARVRDKPELLRWLARSRYLSSSFRATQLELAQ
ncbi:MAG: bacteriophage (phiC31) resistance pglZ, partial [Pseudomonadota bacterium]